MKSGKARKGDAENGKEAEKGKSKEPTTKCTKSVAFNVAGGEEMAFRMLKLWAIWGADASTQGALAAASKSQHYLF